MLDLGAALVTSGLVAIVATDRGGLPRILLALGFMFFVPGRSIVTNWPRMARWSQAAVAIVLSLAVLTLVAMATLWLHAWHPLQLFYAEAGLCLAALGTGVARRRWSMRAGPVSPAAPAARAPRAEPHG